MLFESRINSGRWYQTWTSFNPIEEQTMFRTMFTSGAGRIALFALVLLAPCAQNTLFGQALNMDGQSGIFLQQEADAGPRPHHKFRAPTISFHTGDAGAGAGDYMNVRMDEGSGQWR